MNRERYRQAMNAANSEYASVIDALRAAEVPATVTQTGGMCLAIEGRWARGRHWWLTDSEGPLAWDRDQSRPYGWCAGMYDPDDSEPYAMAWDDDGSDEGAVRCVMALLAEVQRLDAGGEP